MPATLEQAIAAARGADEKNEWLTLDPSQQTRAIYREMRRIDLEEALLTKATSDASPNEHTARLSAERPGAQDRGSAPQQPRCCATLKRRKAEQCSWSAVVKRGGSWFCGLHDPKRSAETSPKGTQARVSSDMVSRP